MIFNKKLKKSVDLNEQIDNTKEELSQEMKNNTVILQNELQAEAQDRRKKDEQHDNELVSINKKHEELTRTVTEAVKKFDWLIDNINLRLSQVDKALGHLSQQNKRQDKNLSELKTRMIEIWDIAFNR